MGQPRARQAPYSLYCVSVALLILTYTLFIYLTTYRRLIILFLVDFSYSLNHERPLQCYVL